MTLRQRHRVRTDPPHLVDARALGSGQHVPDFADLFVDDRQLAVGQQRVDLLDAADHRVLDRQQRIVGRTRPHRIERLGKGPHTRAPHLAGVPGRHEPGRGEVAVGTRLALVDHVDPGSGPAGRLQALLGTVAVIEQFAQHALGQRRRQTLGTRSAPPVGQQPLFPVLVDARQVGTGLLQPTHFPHTGIALRQQAHELAIDLVDLPAQGIQTTSCVRRAAVGRGRRFGRARNRIR